MPNYIRDGYVDQTTCRPPKTIRDEIPMPGGKDLVIERTNPARVEYSPKRPPGERDYDPHGHGGFVRRDDFSVER